MRAETTVEESYRGYRFNRGDLPVALACVALRRSGIEPQLGLTGGGADANVFNERGKACVNLARNGMMEIHTPDRRIAVADLERMVDHARARRRRPWAPREPRGHGVTDATSAALPVASFQDA